MTSRVALGAILLGAGVLWLLSYVGALDLSYQAWIGILLIAIGLAIAFTPGHHGLLTLIGIVILLAGLPALVVDDFVTGGIGDAVEAPTTAADIEDYEHGIGKLTIDLTGPGLADEDLDVKAEAGIGELLVLVPEDASVTVDAHVGIGNIDALGSQEDGVDVDLDEEFPGLSEREIALELDLGLGDIRVQRR
jgi:predicted membrane protein